MKKILAILVALATILSLSACGNYEITIKDKEDDGKSVADSVDEKDESEDEDKKDKDDEDDNDEETEDEAEEEVIVDGVPTFTKDVKKNKKLLEAYLKSFIDFDDFAEIEDEGIDDYGNYSVRCDKGDFESDDVDIEIVLDGNQIGMPTDLETLEACGFDFQSTVYNADSELNANTYGGIDMKNSDDEGFEASFLNAEDSKSKLSECIVNSLSFDNSLNMIDYSFNGLDANSTIEEVAAEYGTPNSLRYYAYDDGRVYVYMYYRNYTEGAAREDEELCFCFELTEEELKSVTYKIPNYNF